MNTTTLILFAALGVNILLLICILAATARGRRARREEQEQVADVLQDGLRSLSDLVARQDAAQSEELLRDFQALDDRLAAALERGTQRQLQQLGAMQQQSYENSRAQELRQHNLHRMTEESMARFEQRVQAVETTLEQKLQQNENRLERMRETLDGNLRQIQTDNAQKLDEMRRTVDEKLNDTLNTRLNQSFAQVSQRLEQVYKSLGEVHTLAQGVGDLKRVLGNVKTRGVWGEVQLGALLQEALASSQYDTNVAVKPGSDERVEFAIRLPGKDTEERPVYLAIDSKFPQEDYTRLVEASERNDASATETARRALIAAVRTEAKRIAGKYIEPPYTTDFAIMFLPLESLYAEVVRQADVVEQLQREQRVIVAGPSTLLALLNSLQMGFRTLAIERRSAEVWRLLGAVKTDFGAFSQVLQRTQEKLQQASDSIDTAFVRTRSIERKLRRVEALDETETVRLLNEPDDEKTEIS